MHLFFSLPETNIEPENGPSPNNIHLPTIDFQGQAVSCSEGNQKRHMWKWRMRIPSAISILRVSFKSPNIPPESINSKLNMWGTKNCWHSRILCCWQSPLGQGRLWRRTQIQVGIFFSEVKDSKNHENWWKMVLVCPKTSSQNWLLIFFGCFCHPKTSPSAAFGLNLRIPQAAPFKGNHKGTSQWQFPVRVGVLEVVFLPLRFAWFFASSNKRHFLKWK